MVQQRNEIDLRLRKETDFLTKVVRTSWVVLFLCILYQIIFFAEITNLIGMAAVVFAWLITTKIWLRPEMLETYLLSAFTIVGFVSTQFYFPLLFTTMENKALTHNLELPEEVFLHSIAAVLVLVVAHAFYRFLMNATPTRSFSFLDKSGFFDPPSHLQLWIMGMLGMASSFYVYFTSPDIGHQVTGAASDKLVQALVPFTYAPFFIPLAKLYGNNQKTHRGFGLMILLYAVLLFAVSIGRNSRGAFIFGFITPAFAYGLGLLLGVFKTRILTVKNIVVAGLVLWFLTGPLSDLGVAMLNVRGTTKEVSAMETIALTIEALDDKEAIRARKAEDINELMDMDWDERYLDNLFTARLANIKYNDASLINYSKVGEYDPDMQAYSLDHFLAQLPDPVLKIFKLDVDKELVLSLSFGDFLYILAGGHGTPGGFRVGQFAGTGMAAYGWWYLLLFGLVTMPAFYLNDKFFRPQEGLELRSSKNPSQQFKFSFCGVLALTVFFQFLGFESVVFGATYLIRGWIQMIILYLLIFHASRALSFVIEKRKRPVHLSPN